MAERDVENEVMQRARKAMAEDPSPATRFWCKAVLRGLSTIKNIGRSFKILDRDDSKYLDKEEFWNANAMWKIQMDKAEFDKLWTTFCGDDQRIDYEEFLNAVRPPMNDIRKKIVEKAFRQIQLNVEEAKREYARKLQEREEQGEQQWHGMNQQKQQQKIPEMPRSATGKRPDFITVEDMAWVYDVSNHSKVQSGQMTEEQAIQRFIDNFQGDQKDDKVTLDEFMDYYRCVGLSHDFDAGFLYMMQMSWGVSLADPLTTNKKTIRKAHKFHVSCH